MNNVDGWTRRKDFENLVFTDTKTRTSKTSVIAFLQSSADWANEFGGVKPYLLMWTAILNLGLLLMFSFFFFYTKKVVWFWTFAHVGSFWWTWCGMWKQIMMQKMLFPRLLSIYTKYVEQYVNILYTAFCWRTIAVIYWIHSEEREIIGIYWES